ncbi:hypothetical protein Tsp_04742, partial [Trichinella spiralis]|uniref:hypothetical protein n=1 Tax=Trichinella spiralis TaxID=6334 RepID=UPI0001EFDBE5
NATNANADAVFQLLITDNNVNEEWVRWVVAHVVKQRPAIPHLKNRAAMIECTLLEMLLHYMWKGWLICIRHKADRLMQ